MLAIQGRFEPFRLPDDTPIGPRIIVETKDEHDWNASGREFGLCLEGDVGKMRDDRFIPRNTPCKFTMLREEHFEIAKGFFGTDDFDRLFVVHAINPDLVSRHKESLVHRKIQIITIADVVADTMVWYKSHPRPAGLRHTMMGDIWHLLVGFCGCEPMGRVL